MAWIESHQSLSRHNKTLDVAEILSISRHEVIGLLMDLWWWGLDNVPSNGFMGNITDKKLAVAAQWGGDPTEFTQALITAGFIEENEYGRWLHDWYDYAGKLLIRREKDVERKRMSKGIPSEIRRNSFGKSTDVRKNSIATVPNSTVPNQTKESGGVGALATAFEQIFGRLMNSVQQEDLFDYMDKGMQVELLISAMRKAAQNGKPFNYSLGIIKRQYNEGIRTVEQAEIAEAERQVAVGGVKYEHSVHIEPSGNPGRETSQTSADYIQQLIDQQGDDDELLRMPEV